ncbi:crustapain-like [Diabrotica virgifera virgifera]|uniref:Cathepsin propeptide inhibitor domain-containing protein n=1 Tax=Diabrotica virgifera virgifera TaxID=50390 RepID=A0ABM5K0N5_DIAVI|nr:crustapain-like [Diabrotica virgifera virgifera]
MISKYFLLLLAVYLVSIVTADTDEEQFNVFMQRFNKSYPSVEEEMKRFKIFQDNLRSIEEHNRKFKRREVTYSITVNRYSDLTQEEILANITGK